MTKIQMSIRCSVYVVKTYNFYNAFEVALFRFKPFTQQ